MALTRIIRIGKQMKFKSFSNLSNRKSQIKQGNAKLWLFLILNGKSAVFEGQSGKFELTENGELHKTRSKPICVRQHTFKINSGALPVLFIHKNCCTCALWSRGYQPIWTIKGIKCHPYSTKSGFVLPKFGKKKSWFCAGNWWFLFDSCLFIRILKRHN